MGLTPLAKYSNFLARFKLPRNSARERPFRGKQTSHHNIRNRLHVIPDRFRTVRPVRPFRSLAAASRVLSPEPRLPQHHAAVWRQSLLPAPRLLSIPLFFAPWKCRARRVLQGVLLSLAETKPNCIDPRSFSVLRSGRNSSNQARSMMPTRHLNNFPGWKRHL